MPLYPLDKCGKFESLVGQKVVNTARLRRAGFPAVNGFAFTFHGIPTDSEIRFAWSQVRHLSPLVVRSSMFGEDGETRSLAGKFHTSLSVTTFDDFSLAVLANASESKSGCVLIQQMVNSVRSGVLFTSFGECDEVLIESCYGLCELLVSGKLTPDRGVYSKHTKEHSSFVKGEHYYALFSSHTLVHNAGIGYLSDSPIDNVRVVSNVGENVLVSIPFKRRIQPVLDTSQLNRLLDIANRLEETFGCPQDVEWTFNEQDELIILQTRPISEAISSLQKSDSRETHTNPSELSLGWHGIPASSGTARGVVRFEGETLNPDEDIVLIAPELSPHMVYDLASVKGIVTELGGMLCHGAIVARELGLPCIVGVRDITSVLKSGDIVELDASKGRVLKC